MFSNFEFYSLKKFFLLATNLRKGKKTPEVNGKNIPFSDD